MNKPHPYTNLIIGIAMGALGLVFLMYGLRLAGLSRVVFLLFGVIDILYAFRAIRHYLIHKKK